MARRRAKRPEADVEVHTDEEGMNLPVHWESPERIPAVFANKIFVRLQEGAFLVTFGQVELPREIRISTETRERLEREGLVAHTVARLVITPANMKPMIEVLERLYAHWEKQQEESSS